MLPALAILLGIELSQSGLTFVSRADFAGRRKRPYRWLSVGVVALVIGFAFRANLALYLWTVTGQRTLQNAHGLGQTTAAAAAWLLVSGIAFVVLLPASYWLPTKHWRIPAGVVLAVIVGFNGLKAGRYYADLTYLLPEASQKFAMIGNRLPRDAQIVVGDEADTLGLGTDFFTFVIRRWEHNHVYLNLDGWERFRPNIALTHDVPAGFVHITDLPLAPDAQGHPRRTVPVYVRDVYASAARAGLAAP